MAIQKWAHKSSQVFVGKAQYGTVGHLIKAEIRTSTV